MVRRVYLTHSTAEDLLRLLRDIPARRHDVETLEGLLDEASDNLHHYHINETDDVELCSAEADEQRLINIVEFLELPFTEETDA